MLRKRNTALPCLTQKHSRLDLGCAEPTLEAILKGFSLFYPDGGGLFPPSVLFPFPLPTEPRILLSHVLQLAEDVPGQHIFDFPVAGDRLANARAGVLVPIMAPPVAEEHASVFLKPLDEVKPFHANCNSATWRTWGMVPLESSL